MQKQTLLHQTPMFILFIAVVTTGVILISGCKKNDNPVTNNDQTVATSDDVADAVGDALASNNGGAIDQVNDVFEIAKGVGVGAGASLGKTASDSTYVLRTFDSTTTSWTLFLFKQRSIPPYYYGVWTRNYWHQFSANGKPQKYLVTGGVVADTIRHKLTSGTGYFWTPRLVHHLRSISSDWTASNTNTDTVTINGTYSRSGVDTIKAAARVGRVLDHSLTLRFIDVKGPRGTRLNRSEKTSGTIQGTYTATITIPSKSQTITIVKTFTITLGGGTATFTVDGTSYTTDLTTGDRL